MLFHRTWQNFPKFCICFSLSFSYTATCWPHRCGLHLRVLPVPTRLVQLGAGLLLLSTVSQRHLLCQGGVVLHALPRPPLLTYDPASFTLVPASAYLCVHCVAHLLLLFPLLRRGLAWVQSQAAVLAQGFLPGPHSLRWRGEGQSQHLRPVRNQYVYTYTVGLLWHQCWEILSITLNMPFMKWDYFVELYKWNEI